jgi:predicted permease
MLRDIKRVWLQSRRNPAVAAAIILAMATSIAVTTAVFAFVNDILIRPFPYRDSEHLAVLWSSERDEPRFAVSPANFLDWKRDSRAFVDMAAIQLFRDRTVAMSGIGEPEEVESVRATWNTFDLLGMRPVLGRNFRKDDAKPGQNPVILIADGLWKRRFGGISSVLGQRVILDGRPAEIVGVLPPHFQLPRTDIESNAEIFLPIAWSASDEQIRGRSCCGVVGRLHANVSLDRAQVELQTIASRLAAEYPATNWGQTVAIDPLFTSAVGDIRPALLTLFAAASVLLLIRSASVSNLLLAQFSARRVQIATQASLGATPGRIARQMLTEAGVLAVVAGVLGLLGTLYALRTLVALIPRTASSRFPGTRRSASIRQYSCSRSPWR